MLVHKNGALFCDTLCAIVLLTVHALKKIERFYLNIPRLIVLFIVLLSFNCGNGQKYDLKTLPTGKQVKVLSIHPLTFGDGPTSMVLAYQTDLKITDSVALRKEVQEIWFFFRDEVNRTNFRGAVISANEVPTGFIVTHNNTFNFVFQKNQDSTWTMSPDYGIPTQVQ